MRRGSASRRSRRMITIRTGCRALTVVGGISYWSAAHALESEHQHPAAAHHLSA